LTKKIRDFAKRFEPPKIESAHKAGDLVKVLTTNYRGDTEYKYGFIVGEQEIEQLSMFPMLPVYVFDSSEVQMHYPLNLEIISSQHVS
tara:strand:- start:76 stop:339 length:264 start_codon:yes stop_codon:yes gene_type:complete